MKSYYILLVAAAALLSSASGISLTQDGGTSTVVKRSLHTFDGIQVNGDSGRFLRSYTERHDSEDPADEERGINSEKLDGWVSKLAANTLSEGDLHSINSKLIAEKKRMYKQFDEAGHTPDSMFESLGIQHKLDTFTDEQLALDGDLHLYLFYEIYWNKAHGKKTGVLLKKLLHYFQKRKTEEA